MRDAGDIFYWLKYLFTVKRVVVSQKQTITTYLRPACASNVTALLPNFFIQTYLASYIVNGYIFIVNEWGFQVGLASCELVAKERSVISIDNRLNGYFFRPKRV